MLHIALQFFRFFDVRHDLFMYSLNKRMKFAFRRTTTRCKCPLVSFVNLGIFVFELTDAFNASTSCYSPLFALFRHVSPTDPTLVVANFPRSERNLLKQCRGILLVLVGKKNPWGNGEMTSENGETLSVWSERRSKWMRMMMVGFYRHISHRFARHFSSAMISFFFYSFSLSAYADLCTSPGKENSTIFIESQMVFCKGSPSNMFDSLLSFLSLSMKNVFPLLEYRAHRQSKRKFWIWFDEKSSSMERKRLDFFSWHIAEPATAQTLRR